MKKVLLAVGIITFSSSLICIVSHLSQKKYSNNTSVGEGDDIGDYYKWEQKRLADPSTGKIPDNIRAIELAYAATLPSDANSPDERLRAPLWASRGPWNVGGRTRAFAADAGNEAILLAGTCSGGMWRSVDSGKAWTLVTPLPIQQGVCCVSQDIRVNHRKIWYYGSGEAYGASASGDGPNAYFNGDGVYRSKDNGQTWSVLGSTLPSHDGYWTAMWSVVSDSSAPDSISKVYAATLGSIYGSSDTGNTWKVLLGHGSNYSYFTDVQVTNTGAVYATLSSSGFYSNVWNDSIGAAISGIWRSPDGVTFTNIIPSNFPTRYNRIVIGISPKDPTQVYFLINTVNSGMPDTNFLGQVEWDELWKYKYLSGDGSGAGGVWYNLTANLPSSGGLFDKFNCQGSYDMVVRFLPNDTATVFIGGTDIFRSTTGFFDASHTAHIGGYGVGASLPSITVYPKHHPDQHVIFFSNSSPYTMYSGCDGGIFKTTNDTAASISWTPLNNGYITTMFYTVATDHTRSGGQVLIGGAQDNNSLFDNSMLQTNPWTKPVFGDGSYCYVEDTGKVFYYSSQQGKMFKAQMDTVNGTLVDFRRIDPIGGKGYQFVNPYVVDPNNNSLMYLAGGKYVWRNNNLAAIPFSNQWDSISTNWVKFPDSVSLAGSNVTAVAISTIPANRLYYGTDNKHVYRIDNANIGSPVPTEITQLSGPNQFPSAYVSSIAVDPADADNVMVTFSNYGVQNIFYSSNGGTSWTREGNKLANTGVVSVRWASFQHLTSGDTVYWIGASTGLYATNQLKGNATIWVQQASGTIGNAVCDMIDVRPIDGLVAVATHAHGIYTANITSLSNIATVQDIVPEVSGLQLNTYPNPFAGKTTISFNLPEDTHVKLRVYNVEGKLVKQLSDGQMQKGQHTIEFEAQDLPGSIYFCTLQAGDVMKTSKIVLVK